MSRPGRQKTPPQKNTQPDPLAVRRLAIDVLDACLHDRQPLDAVLADALKKQELESRDRQFLRQLLFTTLRRMGEIDARLKEFIKQKIPARGHRMKQLLRLAVAELGAMQTPDHAVLHNYVELTKRSKDAARAGFVNAVLRNMVRSGQILPETPAPLRNSAKWLREGLLAAYGEAETLAILTAQAAGAGVDLQVKQDAEGWAEKLGATLLPLGGLRLPPSGDVRKLEGYDEGAWWVQDIAASLPVQLLGDVRGKQVIDLCAAPGGKTAQLAAHGAHVTALDSNAKRLERLRENLARLQFTIHPSPFRGRVREGVKNITEGVEILHANAGTWQPATPPDAVLLDAPCSASGIIRRHPDIQWVRTPKEIEELHATQCRLLAHTLGWLPKGATLVYAVCSLLPIEGEAVVEKVLKEFPTVSRQPVTATELDGHGEWITPSGDLRTLPCHLPESGGMDGFYAARLSVSV